MRQFDFYEFTGVIAPGAVFLFGVAILFPEFGKQLQGQDFTVGSLGLFLVLAYVAGHLVQALGNALEWTWWKLWGGWPTGWPRTGKGNLLSDPQRKQLRSRIAALLALPVGEDPFELQQKSWMAVVRQIDAAVKPAESRKRIETFNGNYGLNRGIAASLLALVILTVVSHGSEAWRPALLLAIGACVAVYRMHRFGRHYGRELFVQFLVAEEPERGKAQ
jgi:hypothetical protein